MRKTTSGAMTLPLAGQLDQPEQVASWKDQAKKSYLKEMKEEVTSKEDYSNGDLDEDDKERANEVNENEYNEK